MDHSLNQRIFLAINNFAGKSHLLDLMMEMAAKYIPYLFIALLFCLWYGKRKNEALYAGYSSIVGIFINFILGLFYFHSRPFVDHLGIVLLSHKTDSSFPSDHTTFTMSIAFTLLAFKSTRGIGIITTFFALWCGVARVFVGVHYPFDILGSAIVSILTVIIVLILKHKLSIINNFIISIKLK